MKRVWVAIGAAGVMASACSTSPNPTTANEACSAYIDSHDDTHQAVTRHVAAVLWGSVIDAAAPTGTVHVTPVGTLVNKVSADQLSATEAVVTRACQAAPSSSALDATVSATGSGTIPIPDVFSAP